METNCKIYKETKLECESVRLSGEKVCDNCPNKVVSEFEEIEKLITIFVSRVENEAYSITLLKRLLSRALTTTDFKETKKNIINELKK